MGSLLLARLSCPRKKDIHFWCDLRESTSALFPRSLENFKSHRRYVSAVRFDKKLSPSLVRHATWRDRRAWSILSEEKRYRGSLELQKARRGIGINEEEQRSREYLTSSGIVNYAMQIRERHAVSAIQRGVCGSCIQVRSCCLYYLRCTMLCRYCTSKLSWYYIKTWGRSKHGYS